jgi:hypothetical protein
VGSREESGGNGGGKLDGQLSGDMYGQIADSYLSRPSETHKDAMLQPLICVLWLTMWSNAMYWLLEGVTQCTGYMKE